MSITLKNITAADTISSMVDKINFNFDQLILNGGGIEGPQGIEGQPGMQGVKGDEGDQGIKGDTGERGVHFHILTLSDVQNAIQNGLGETDPDGDEYKDGDMIIALTSTVPGGVPNYTDSLWTVVERNNNFYPEDEKVFRQTTHFNEVNGTSNALLRSAPTDAGHRGIILNDCENDIDISPDQIDAAVNNNVALVYTKAFSGENNNDSPNCGIVFFKSGETSKEIGLFPRINYIISPNYGTDDINYLNIIAPEQHIHISAKKDVIVSSEEGNIVLKTNSQESNIELKHNDSVYVKIEENDTNTKKIELSADEILFAKENNNPAQQWAKFKEETNNFVVELLKNSTFVKSDGIFSIGKSGREILDPNNIVGFYNQSRITIDNTNSVPSVKIVAKKVSIGRDIEEDTIDAFQKFGINAEQNKISIYSRYQSGRETSITINSNNDKLENIYLKTPYPGVTKISNVSEEYNDCLINYDDTNIIDVDHKFYTGPMYDKFTSGSGTNSRYKYAHCNFYQNMYIRNVKNMGAVHAGSITFTGNYGGSTTGVVDKITYNFTRVGNIVQCTFHGIIDTQRVCARGDGDISLNLIDEYSESILKGTGTIITSWPGQTLSTANTGNSYFTPSNGSYTGGLNLSGITIRDRGSIVSATPSLVVTSYNKIYLNLYPPVIKLTQNGSTYKTNVKNLIGHLTYSNNNAIYERELSYTDTITSSQSLYRIPPITITQMQNSTIASRLRPTISITSITDNTIDGSTTQNLVELDGYFSYLIDCIDTDMHRKIIIQSSNTYGEYSEEISNGRVVPTIRPATTPTSVDDEPTGQQTQPTDGDPNSTLGPGSN